MRGPLVCAAALVLVACGDPRTEIFVVVEGDLDVPSELDSVEVEVVAPDGAFETARADVTTGPLPRTLGVVWDGGRLDPFVVTARGSVGGSVTVEQSARVAFLHEQTVVLRLRLDGSCVGDTCGLDETCSAGVCVSVDVDADSLESFTGVDDATSP